LLLLEKHRRFLGEYCGFIQEGTFRRGTSTRLTPSSDKYLHNTPHWLPITRKWLIKIKNRLRNAAAHPLMAAENCKRLQKV
jgi:hypothetical protein